MTPLRCYLSIKRVIYEMNHIEPHVYTEDQYRNLGVFNAWNILLDAHNAVVYGFVKYRLPEPGKAIDVAEAEAHIAHIEKEWEAERQKRDPSHQWTGAPPFTAMPVNAKLYLHSVLAEKEPVEFKRTPHETHPPVIPITSLSLGERIRRWFGGKIRSR